MSERGFRAAWTEGMEAFDAGDLVRAERCMREVLEERPRTPEVLCVLGVICAQTGRMGEGIEQLQQAVSLKPYFFEAMANLGAALVDQGKSGAEAEQVLRQAMAMQPTAPEVIYNLGRALHQQGKYADAVGSYREALALNPGMLHALRWLGSGLAETGALREAIEVMKRVVELTGGPTDILLALADMLRAAWRLPEAAEIYKRVIAKEPGVLEYRSAALTLLDYVPEVDGETAYRAHLAYHEQHAAGLEGRLGPLTNGREPEKRLKVGYVSVDFRRHSVSFFIEGLLARHDHSKVEVYVYSGVGPRADAVTERLKQYADVWVEIAGMPHEALAERVRADGIDVLVDLMGHTPGVRLQTFARRAAPVQVTYLGYPDTTGLRAMDYRLTDAVADPLDLTDPWHTETLVRLRSFLCYRPPMEAPEVDLPPAASKGVVTFGGVHLAEKVSSMTVDLWGQTMAAVPGSRLLLKGWRMDADLNRDRVMAGLGRWGVGPERVNFLPMVASTADHLATYGRMDVVLDAWPYNGTTTTCDALWMGVPVVTLAGDRHVSRVGASILTAAGLKELIAGSPAEFVQIAKGLAGDVERMRMLRAGMRERLKRSVLLDEVGFARDVEEVYRKMWRAWCEGGRVTGGMAGDGR